jgi:hypothetical protein
VSFESEFFGPGNRLKWEAIQAGSLSADAQKRLGPFIEQLQGNPDVLVLPRVREDGRVQWYVLCESPRAGRIARDELRGFLGATYSNFEGRPTTLDPNDPVEAAVLRRCGTDAFRVDVPDAKMFDVARERLQLYIRLRKERPNRYVQRVRPVGRILRDFEYALSTQQELFAAECIEELRITGGLSAANLLFLDIRRLAAGSRWDAILAVPELDSLLSIVRPRRVTEALIRAVYATRLRQFEEDGRASEALEYFRSQVVDRFRDLYKTRANISGYEIDASFLLAAAASTPGRPEIVEPTLAKHSPNSPQFVFLSKIAALIAPGLRPARLALLADARAAFAEADVDRAYELAIELPASFDRSALLLRCAQDMGSLAATQVALVSLEGLSGEDRLRLSRHTGLSHIHDSLVELMARGLAAPAEIETPSTWQMWLNRLGMIVPWKGAVSFAEAAAREWSVEDLLGGHESVGEIAELLLAERPEWGQTALRDGLPFFLEFCLSAGVDARLKPVYESLFLLMALDPQVSLPMVGSLATVAGARLQLGVSTSEYGEILQQLAGAIQTADSPAVADIALEALESVINSACPDTLEREQFAFQVIALFQRWHTRLDAAQFAVLRSMSTDLGTTAALQGLGLEKIPTGASSDWAPLNGKRVALYSLQESALRRAVEVVTELCPGVRVDIFHDHVGGSPALRKASAAADVFVIATGAAKHAATTFIEARRPKGAITLYARGQGSTSLVHALHEHLSDHA